jgi:hypothetical protein
VKPKKKGRSRGSGQVQGGNAQEGQRHHGGDTAPQQYRKVIAALQQEKCTSPIEKKPQFHWVIKASNCAR